jgi:hypothetical protein
VTHPLDADPFAKVTWAEKYLGQLETERQRWMSSNPYLAIAKPDADKTLWTVMVDRFDDLVKPERDLFGFIIGDYIHNLRSALDHLVWQLVTVANRKKIKQQTEREIYFPVISPRGHPRDFWNSPPVKQRHLTLEQSLYIEGFQPYRGGNEPRALWDLHTLWNTDKHRLITDIAVTLNRNGPILKYTDAHPTEERWDSTVRLEGQTDIAWITVAHDGPNPEVIVEGLPVDVAVGEAGRLIQDIPALLPFTRSIIFGCAGFF